MTNISKKPLSVEATRNIGFQFAEVVTHLQSKKKAKDFFEDLLSDAEEMMLHKRLAVIFMLHRGFSFTTVRECLKVSPSTVAKVARTLDRGGYAAIVCFLEQKKVRETLQEDIEKLLRGGLPRYGKGRWKKVHELIDKR
ncbi:hypothetical protein COV42_00605 [Candidatus Campbellbacteria bacterium CG11_big_fil_rev_8_21_14_0_20_44_21]|uniref:TrpR like protein, YerC/YecD n=1 Tax=Candidatus Campbellbacteria bacterium CG22_combo_CG10-13_8_21_14_all_43_18 TaxID=1974530 RepID=A0A2H0DWD1_9BACT|nr:MAG: hypothetical protein COW82_01800 [Candidatus Campbellbacteria bacterium CG22_combo_CG10-13_8_21_14_all_43_18]PIR24465.1 MAG: hypothetical protein COV42_00605 [Candidatus Campbellbacteria bacterium CG11_big_fil_rev_8_21_14_0_20_44_21]